MDILKRGLHLQDISYSSHVQWQERLDSEWIGHGSKKHRREVLCTVGTDQIEPFQKERHIEKPNWVQNQQQIIKWEKPPLLFFSYLELGPYGRAFVFMKVTSRES